MKSSKAPSSMTRIPVFSSHSVVTPLLSISEKASAGTVRNVRDSVMEISVNAPVSPSKSELSNVSLL